MNLFTVFDVKQMIRASAGDKSNNVLIDRCALSSDLISKLFRHLECHRDEIENKMRVYAPESVKNVMHNSMHVSRFDALNLLLCSFVVDCGRS